MSKFVAYRLTHDILGQFNTFFICLVAIAATHASVGWERCVLVRRRSPLIPVEGCNYEAGVRFCKIRERECSQFGHLCPYKLFCYDVINAHVCCCHENFQRVEIDKEKL